ncbi:hypothetical protein ACTXT7_011737 [Hymenolepis weldensis]
MKLFSLQVLYKCDPKPKLLQSTYELSSFGFFQRASVQEFLDFTAKLVCERTEVCARSAVQERDYFCHIFVRHDNLCGVVFSDQEYSQRVAQTLLTKTLEDFTTEYPPSTWSTLSAGENEISFVEILQPLRIALTKDFLVTLVPTLILGKEWHLEACPTDLTSAVGHSAQGVCQWEPVIFDIADEHDILKMAGLFIKIHSIIPGYEEIHVGFIITESVLRLISFLAMCLKLFVNPILDMISWKRLETETTKFIRFDGANMRKLGEYLLKYQDPRQADSLTKLQADVEDTTQIIQQSAVSYCFQQTLETLIERGEKLDDLVSKSEDLSSQSKLFYQTILVRAKGEIFNLVVPSNEYNVHEYPDLSLQRKRIVAANFCKQQCIVFPAPCPSPCSPHFFRSRTHPHPNSLLDLPTLEKESENGLSHLCLRCVCLMYSTLALDRWHASAHLI